MAKVNRGLRWDPCIVNHGDDVDQFLDQHFSCSDRRILIVAGAGFDPRASLVAGRLRKTKVPMRALLIRERRPDPSRDLLERADKNESVLRSNLTEVQVQHIDVFGSDGALVGGRNVVKALRPLGMEGITDVVVDISALSVGMSFPIIRYFLERIDQGHERVNLHVFVAHAPHLDANIRARASDDPGYVHGFRGRLTLDENQDAARLWLPQLATGRRQALAKLYDFVEPQDTCPILPFPSTDPRLGDKLAAEYLSEIENTWDVDSRNIVYADEEDPLDLYRTTLRLDDLRQNVFKETGGSMLVLSPLGSKVMALGALLAALERDLPVAHLESIGYELEPTVSVVMDTPRLIHLWLEGEAYPQPRPSFLTSGRDRR